GSGGGVLTTGLVGHSSRYCRIFPAYSTSPTSPGKAAGGIFCGIFPKDRSIVALLVLYVAQASRTASPSPTGRPAPLEDTNGPNGSSDPRFRGSLSLSSILCGAPVAASAAFGRKTRAR